MNVLFLSCTLSILVIGECTEILHPRSVPILPSVNALAIERVVEAGGGRGSQSQQQPRSRPKFYSDIISPLAQIADHACLGEQVPSVLDITNINKIPEYESLAAHIIFNNNKQKKGQEEQPEDDSFQTITTTGQVITTATFAGGCFGGIQLAFDREPGVIATCVGYTQGNNDTTCTFPTYSEVCSEETGHTEACLVAYDPILVSYSRLAELMFDFIPDPTMLNRVGKDRGTQYRTGLYGHSNEQLKMEQVAFDRENRMWFGREVMTEVKHGTIFWPAEEHHQCYLEKGGRYGRSQISDKGCNDEIRCYG
jgi:peptide-methionine (S)-S-oxide reductase